MGFTCSSLFGQDYVCGTTSDEEESVGKLIPSTQSSCSGTVETGAYIPSKDTLYINVIFAMFADDDDDVDGWSVGTFPSFVYDFIDTSATVNSSHRYNLTNYFRTFSTGNFIVIGKVDTITVSKSMFHADFTSTSYFTNVQNANKLVFDSLNTRNDFYVFDRWKIRDSNINYCHNKTSDGIMDPIGVIWRSNRFNQDSKIGGFARDFLLSGPSDLKGENGNVTRNYTHGLSVTPSGNIIDISLDTYLNIFVHEFAHLLIQGSHSHIQSSSQHRGAHSFPSLLSEFIVRTTVPNPLELELLDWVEPKYTITSNGTYELGDYETTSDYAKYHDVESGNLMYFFNSNRQGIYDQINHNDNDVGVFIMHHRNSDLKSGYVSGTDANNWVNRMVSSEGDYQWAQMNPYFHDASHPFLTGIFSRLKPDPVSGRSHLTMLLRNDRCFATNDVQWLGALGDTSRSGVAPTGVSTSCYYINEPYAYADTSVNFTGRGLHSGFSYENNRAYFSSITNPMTKRYQHYNSTSTAVALPISVHILPTNLNGSRSIKVRFSEDPFNIDTDRVWSGEIFIPDTVSVVVSNNATLTILPDTRIFLGKNNARITTTGGGKIIAIGTQSKPITFTTSYDTGSWSHTNEWGQVNLMSGGNRFEWCVFEYGTKHIEISSRDNEIRNTIFRNGWRGMSSYSNQSGSGPTNSEVLVDQVLMTGNRTVGFVGYYSDSKLSNVTITHNGEAGAWYESANGLSFHKSRVDSNAVSSSTRSGVEANSGSVVHLLRYHSGSYLQGDNSIRAQPQYQVLRANGSTLHMGNYYTIGEPGWSNIQGGSSYLIRNYGSGTVTAHENYWGMSDPTNSEFEGSVDFDFYHSTAVNVFGASSLPVESHYYKDQFLKVLPSDDLNVTDMDRQAEEQRGLIRQRAAQLRQQMDVSSPDPDDVGTFLDLYTLMWDPQWYEQDVDANRAVLSQLYAQVIKQNAMSSNEVRVIELQLRDWVSNSPRLAESAALDLLETQQHFAVRLAATQVLMSISEQKGDLTVARDYLRLVSELNRGAGQPEDVVTSYASMMEGIFATRPEQRFMKGSGLLEQSPSKTTENPKPEPVLTVFPNPFNPETVVTIELQSEQRVRIEVYNTLGQRVQTLMDGQLTTGRHSVRMDGSGMASGVYLIRVHTSQHTMTHRVTLIK